MIRFSVAYLYTDSAVLLFIRNVHNSRAAPTKFVPLSECMWEQIPHLAKNSQRAAKKAAVNSMTSSTWTARMEKHTKTAFE